MKNFSFLILLLVTISCGKGSFLSSINSPDNKITLNFTLDNGKPFYSINKGDKIIVSNSSLGLILKNGIDLSKGSGTWSAALGYLTSGSNNWRGIGSWSTKIKKTDIVIGFERIGDLNSRKFNESTIDQEKSLLYYRLKETIEYQSSNRVNIDLNSKINDKNIIRINTLVWFNGKENAPEIQEYFSPTDIKNEAFYKKIHWDRREDNDGWEFGGDWEHQINKNHSLKLRVVLTEENEDQSDISFLNDTENLYNNSTETNIRKENERIIRLSFNKLIGKSSSLEYGFESAYNKLNRSFNLKFFDSNSIETNAGLINTSGLVEEDRYEGFLSYNLPISEKIRAELALNYECISRYIKSVNLGLLKIMSKMGISVLSSYRGGCNFENSC